ncbi:SDR family NAD(P)-dependent oxidoreductase [Nocardia farcinica]|uniref:SDR family NAD(P)-dependent oxidoreductase n=1 Tax=Nocardia farcinica TaxID=37329 RepID=UPI002457141E|nr:glucose 1-dehydrogenase [Nocardia farcinica]
MNTDLTGRVALVTGASRGLGLAIARGLKQAGATVIVSSRKLDSCERAVATLADVPTGAAHPLALHVGQWDTIEPAVDAIIAEFGSLDIVVNNAANALAQPLATMAPEAVDKSFGVNVQGPLFLVQAALPHLRASEHAAVLNLGSVAALQFAPGLSMYAAGKAALLSFTRAMAAEFAADGIRVNAMAPGAVNTDMVRKNPPEFIAAMAQAPLLRRIAEPDEMVGAALLLCSDAGSFITGQTFLVDGGTVAR